MIFHPLGENEIEYLKFNFLLKWLIEKKICLTKDAKYKLTMSVSKYHNELNPAMPIPYAEFQACTLSNLKMVLTLLMLADEN